MYSFQQSFDTGDEDNLKANTKHKAQKRTNVYGMSVFRFEQKKIGTVHSQYTCVCFVKHSVCDDTFTHNGCFHSVEISIE